MYEPIVYCQHCRRPLAAVEATDGTVVPRDTDTCRNCGGHEFGDATVARF